MTFAFCYFVQCEWCFFTHIISLWQHENVVAAATSAVSNNNISIFLLPRRRVNKKQKELGSRSNDSKQTKKNIRKTESENILLPFCPFVFYSNKILNGFLLNIIEFVLRFVRSTAFQDANLFLRIFVFGLYWYLRLFTTYIKDINTLSIHVPLYWMNVRLPTI